MNDLQLELTRLIGKKEWTSGLVMKDEFGVELFLVGEKAFDGDNDVYLYSPEQKETCHWFNNEEYTKQKKGWEIIGHPATLSDFHRFLEQKEWWSPWQHDSVGIYVGIDYQNTFKVNYDSSKELLEQDAKILEAILSFVKENK